MRIAKLERKIESVVVFLAWWAACLLVGVWPAGCANRALVTHDDFLEQRMSDTEVERAVAALALRSSASSLPPTRIRPQTVGGITAIPAFSGLTERDAARPGDAWLRRQADRIHFAEQLDCVAETATEYLATGLPESAAVELMRDGQRRCGIMEPRALRLHVSQLYPERVIEITDEAWATAFQPHESVLRQALKDAADGDGPVWAGVHQRHVRDRAIAVVAEYRPAFELVPVAYDQNGSTGVWLRGRLDEGVVGIRAAVSDGEWGAVTCEIDTRESLPHFAVWCPLQPTDERAWIELTPVRDSGVRRVEIGVEVSPSGATDATQTSTSYPGCQPHDSGGGLEGDEIVAVLNTLRTELGRAELNVDSRRNTLFEGLLENTTWTGHLPSPELLAVLSNGYRIQEDLTDYRTWSGSHSFVDVCSAFLDRIKSSPTQRLELLGARWTEAIASTGNQNEQFGWLIATYSLMDDTEPALLQGADIFVRRVARFREELGLRPQHVVDPRVGDFLQQVIDHFESGGYPTPSMAADDANRLLRRWGITQLHVSAITSSSPTTEPIPATLLRRRLTFVVTVLASRKKRGTGNLPTFAHYTVLMVTEDT